MFRTQTGRAARHRQEYLWYIVSPVFRAVIAASRSSSNCTKLRTPSNCRIRRPLRTVPRSAMPRTPAIGWSPGACPACWMLFSGGRGTPSAYDRIDLIDGRRTGVSLPLLMPEVRRKMQSSGSVTFSLGTRASCPHLAVRLLRQPFFVASCLRVNALAGRQRSSPADQVPFSAAVPDAGCDRIALIDRIDRIDGRGTGALLPLLRPEAVPVKGSGRQVSSLSRWERGHLARIWQSVFTASLSSCLHVRSPPREIICRACGPIRGGGPPQAGMPVVHWVPVVRGGVAALPRRGCRPLASGMQSRVPAIPPCPGRGGVLHFHPF